jgi:nitrite reductase/ring-hydroxylating ferredoxin subunit
MSDAWKSYPDAPDPGTYVCAARDVAETGTLCVDIGGFPLLLISRQEQVTAFVNACPHQFLPLNYKGDKLLSADGTMVRCTNHGAAFDVETGEGVEGLGIACTLDRVPLQMLADGCVVIG